MIELNKMNQIILSTKCILESNLKKINKLCLVNNRFYLAYKNNCNEKDPFNIILASSDLYYRENYHSDIISYILNHRKKYIKLFIRYLNMFENNNIEDINYIDPKVTREENRIDVLIKDDKTMHCIIIENKINNADDTFRQLPKYYCSLIDNGYTVDAIIYLSIDGNKQPDKSTWRLDDHKLGLEKIITYCAVSNKSESDLVNGFLDKCLLESEYIQENTFFRQYIDLLLYLRRNQMDKQLMEKFYNQMQEEDNYNTALSLKSMLEDLIEYRRNSIHEKYINNYNPFAAIRIYSSDDLYFENIPDISVENIKIDIVFKEKNTVIQFWIDKPNIKYDLIKIILETFGLINDFSYDKENCYRKEFFFPNEEIIFKNFLAKLLSSLKENTEKIKESMSAQNHI